MADTERPVATTFGYDTLGRRTSETSRVGTRTVRSTTSNWLLSGGAWRRNTNRADGASQVELFDAMGRLSSMSRPWAGRQSQWRYEGELETMELHDTATTQFQRVLAYDGLNQLQVNGYSTGAGIYATSLLRDRAGRVVSANRTFSQPGQADSKAWRGYKYQQGGALETVMELDDTVPTAGLNPTDTTWAQVQAVGQAKAAAQFDYTRDIEGSVLSINRVDIAAQSPRFESPARQRGYQMEWYKLDGSGGGVWHDGAGRVTAEFNRTYTYDDFHSLVRAGAASGNNAQGFQYDAVGRLIAVRRGTAGWPVEEELAYDGTQMVAAWNGAGVATWSALWGQGVDNLISVKPGVDGAEVMALKDGRGSVVGYYQAEATPQGLLATADYTPEGRVTSKDWVTGTTCTETGSTQCPRLGGLPFGFHGAYKSPAHGLLYFRNRWYSAEAGQWLTQDPLGEVDSVNLYAFNRFDSVNFIDPFGLERQGAACTAENYCTKVSEPRLPWWKTEPYSTALKGERDWSRHNQAPEESDPTEPARSAAAKVAAFMGGAATGVVLTVTPGAAFVQLKPTGDKAFDVGKNVALIVAGAYLMAIGAQGMAAGAGGEAVPVLGQVAGTAAVAASAAVAAQGLAATGQGLQGLAAAMSGNASRVLKNAGADADFRLARQRQGRESWFRGPRRSRYAGSSFESRTRL